MNNTNYQPTQYHSVTPYLVVRDAARAINFYTRTLGGKEVMRMPGPDNKVMHAEIQFGDSRIMLCEESPACNARGPLTIGGTPVTLLLYVPDVDAVTARAVAAGATILRPVEDQFYGDRAGTITDPFGHQWTLSTHKEDLTMEQIRERATAAMSAHGHA